MQTITKHISKKIAGLLIVALLSTSIGLAPINHRGEVQEAHALGVVVLGGNGTVQGTISAAANSLVAGFQGAFNIKEFTLDGILYGLAKTILKSMTRSIVNWINSGFKGKPAFVQDLKQHLRDRFDEIVGEYIYNDPSLNFLCSPFQLDVKIALALSYQEAVHGSALKCTLSDVTDNIQGFLSGTFEEGGWESWFEVTQQPVNTPTGALLEAKSEMYARIIDEQGKVIKELDWGDGFLSFKVCADTDPGAKKDCDITTPGKVIADQINKSLGAGQDVLVEADEINEIIGALFAQLAKQAITGVYGLLGLTGGSGGRYTDTSFRNSNGQSYLEALDEENQGNTKETPFSKSIVSQKEYIQLQNTTINRIRGARATLATAKTTARCPAFESIVFPTALTDIETDAVNANLKANTTLTQLHELETDYAIASTAGKFDTLLDLVGEYNELLATKEVKTQIDVVQYELFIGSDIDPLLNRVHNMIRSADEACNENGR